MKQNKGTQYQRFNKTQQCNKLEIKVANPSKSVECKLNYLSESNRVTACPRAGKRRNRRSSDGSSAHQQNRHKNDNKKSSEFKLKHEFDEIPRQKSGAIFPFIQSPRRNGLSPRDPDEDYEDDDDDTKIGQSMNEVMDDEFDQQLNMGHNRRSQLSIKHMHKPTYSCSSCGAIFHIKSLLGAHRRTHDDDFKVRFRSRRLRETSSVIQVTGKQCKYCDRVFDLERALHIHQMCHCNKITPQQRRKLAYTDLAHEKKNAPLPNFQRLPKGPLPATTLPDPNMPYVALGPAALRMIEQEQQMKAKRRNIKYTVKVAGPMGRWR